MKLKEQLETISEIVRYKRFRLK